MRRSLYGLLIIFLIVTAASSPTPNRPLPSPAKVPYPPQPQAGSAQMQPGADQRGTENEPVIVKVLPTLKTKQEADQEQTDRQDVSSSNWWMVRLTGVLAFLALVQAIVFGLQARRLRQTIVKMDEIATGQTADMRDSIAEWQRVAAAMEGVSTAMANNVTALDESVATSKRIADYEEIIGKLQTRAYLAVEYIGIVSQNNTTKYRFEPRLKLSGSGLTPAYKVSYRAAADIQPFPLPEDFTFPLPEALPTASVGMLGPRNSFTLSAVAPRLYSDLEISEIKAGVRQRLYIWGIVTYEDAFKIPRTLKFGQSIMWFEDGVSSTSFNTRRHNDAD
jgi:hypothetical protein